MNLIEKYKHYKERLKADREAFESSSTSSVQKKENLKEEAAQKPATNTVLTPSASLSRPTSSAKPTINAQAQNETASHTMRQAVPPSPSMMAKKAIMMPTTNAQTRLLPPGAVLMKGPPPSGAKIMMHNPAASGVAAAALSSTTSVAASRPVSPRVPSANTSQTMLHGNMAQVQGTPLLGAQRLASPPLQRMAPPNNSFMTKTPLEAPLSSTQFQHPQQQQQQLQQRPSPPGVQMVKMTPPPPPMQARLSTSQTNLHPLPPQPQTAMKKPVPLPPHLNAPKIAMGVANMRSNVIQPPNMLATHKVVLPAPPAGGKVSVKAPPMIPTSPQRAGSVVAQTQLGTGGAINKNNNISNNPPVMPLASLQTPPHSNLETTTTTLLASKTASFARNQQSPGNSTSSNPMNASTHALAANQNVQGSSLSPPPAPSRVGANNVRGQGAVVKPGPPVHANTSAANALLEHETSTPVFMENDELSEIQFHVEPTPQAASTVEDVRSDRTDEIKFEEVKVEELPAKKANANSNNNNAATDTTNNNTSVHKTDKDSNSNKAKRTNSHSVSASLHPRSSSESSADFVEETVAPRDGESTSKNKSHTSKSKLHEVANANAELHETTPLEITRRPSTSRRKISVRRRRRRHSSKNDENDSIDRKGHQYRKDRRSNNSDTSNNVNVKHKSNSVVTEVFNDDKPESDRDNHHHRHRRRDKNNTISKRESHVSKGNRRKPSTSTSSSLLDSSLTSENSRSSSSVSSSESRALQNHLRKTTLSSKEASRTSNKKHHHHHQYHHRHSVSDDGNNANRRSSLSTIATKTMTTAKLDPRFTAFQLTSAPLTSSLRTRIAEQFLSILCPQQYYGIVKKIHNIRPIHSDKRNAVELRDGSSILVATKGTEPNRYFYPQLRLDSVDDEHGIHVYDKKEENVNDAIDTPIILYEAAPGTMLFANNELDAARLLQAADDDEDEDQDNAMTNASKEQMEKGKSTRQYNGTSKNSAQHTNRATSCFVVSKSAILFRQPERNVEPIAQLNVYWVPYTSPSSEPQCAIHKKEMQLFAPESKELVCALCAHKSGINTEELIVIPDVIKTNSRRRLFELLQRQLEKATHITSGFVNEHQRLAKLKSHQKEAIDQQFDLLRAALESKRKEFYEAAETEYNYAMSEVARNVLSTDEKVQLLQAASAHLHGDITKPLYSMQIATIAEGLEVMHDKSLHLSKAQQQQEQLEFNDEYRPNRSNTASLSSRAYNYALPSLTHLTPNLEKVMIELQAISATPSSSEMSTERHTQNRKSVKTKNTVPEIDAFMQNAKQSARVNSPTSWVSSPVYITPQSRSRTAPLRRSFTSPLLPRHAFNSKKNDGDYIHSYAREKHYEEEEEDENGNNNVRTYMWPAYHRHINSRSSRVGNNSHESRINYNNENREWAKSHSAWEKRHRNKTLSWHSNTYGNNTNMMEDKAFRTIDDALASYEERSSLAWSSPQQQRRQQNGIIEAYKNERQRLLRSAPEHALEWLLEEQKHDQQQEQYREKEQSENDSLVSQGRRSEINGEHGVNMNRRNRNYNKMRSFPYVVVKAGSDADNEYRFSDERAAYDTSNVRNSSGTFLFDFPIHELFINACSSNIGYSNDSNSANDVLSESYNSNNNNNTNGINSKLSPLARRAQTQRRRFAKERVVRWHVRIDDAGDWVGIGVGVGCTLSQWIQSKQNDFSHLWIVPQSSNAQTFVLEVRVRRGVSHAKLTVYDLLGKQLDEGNIPQWNANRPCYPQATFGGRTGVVRIVEPPHLVESGAHA